MSSPRACCNQLTFISMTCPCARTKPLSSGMSRMGRLLHSYPAHLLCYSYLPRPDKFMDGKDVAQSYFSITILLDHSRGLLPGATGPLQTAYQRLPGAERPPQ